MNAHYIKFQSYFSPIQTEHPRLPYVLLLEFQSYFSPIQTQVSIDYIGIPDVDFNPILVRFKRTQEYRPAH